MPENKEWLLSKSKQLLNYLIFKIGLFAIASVWGIADFVNATSIIRILYVFFFIGLVFYIFLYVETKKYLQEVDRIIKSTNS